MDQIAEVAKTLSHDDLLEVSKSSLQTFLSSDSLLSDLPPDILLEEINSLVRYIIIYLFLRCSVVVDNVKLLSTFMLRMIAVLLLSSEINFVFGFPRLLLKLLKIY